MPKDTDEEKAARKAAVQAGLIVAADVPLEICRVAVDVCRLSKVAAELGNPQAVTDAGIGAILGEAAVVAPRSTCASTWVHRDCDYTRPRPPRSTRSGRPRPCAKSSRCALKL
jgi:hypothetical protein